MPSGLGQDAADDIEPVGAAEGADAEGLIEGCSEGEALGSAEKGLAEGASENGASDGEALGARVLARARALVETTAGEPAGLGDIFVYREGGAIRQCHVVPLHQFATLECERVPALLPVLFGAERAERTKRRAGSDEQARNALRARSAKRLEALTRERAVLERERADAESRERLRQCGEALYA